MPRQISDAALAQLTSRTGGEPVNILGIYWLKDGNVFYYCDRKINDQVLGKLIDLGDLEGVLDITRSTSTVSLRVKLDDSDGIIKSIFDTNDVHYVPVDVYQWFSNLNFDDKFLIYEGLIASPIEWNEGDRTFSFDIISKLYDAETGFSVEEGDFVNVPYTMYGKPWPMVFGTVQNSKTLQVDILPSGSTTVPLCIPNPGLANQLAYMQAKIGEQLAKIACISDNGAELKNKGLFNNDKRLYNQGLSLQRQASDMQVQVAQNINRDFTRLSYINAYQLRYDLTQFSVVNGHLFTQDTEITIEISGALYTGSFSNDLFTVTKRRSPYDPVNRVPISQMISPDLNSEFVIGRTQQEDDEEWANMVFQTNQSVVQPLNLNVAQQDPCNPPNLLIYNNVPPKSPGQTTNGQNFFVQAGAAVKVGGEYPVRYIISIIPNTTVIELLALQAYNTALAVLTPIPPQYYSIMTVEFPSAVPGQYSITATVAYFSQPLSTRTVYDPLLGLLSEGWHDDVYANVQSGVGSNVVDVITWFIETYSAYGIDSVSFNYVRSIMENYPTNFALYDRQNLIDLLKNIAYQARCAIWLAEGVFYLKYLPEQDTIIDTITEDDIEANSLVVTSTNTEDLVTKMTVSWRADYYTPDVNYVVLRQNIDKYGLYDKDIFWFIYTNEDLVIKSATYWLIRQSNIWKVLQLKTFIHKLKAETLDTVLINFSHPYVANGAVAGVLQKASFDSNNLTIDWEVWLPVLLGQMTTYDFAYPANIDESLVYPMNVDVSGGTVVLPPSGDLTATGNVTRTYYNSVHPSDKHDTVQNGWNPGPIITTIGAFGPLARTGASPRAPVAVRGALPGRAVSNTQNAADIFRTPALLPSEQQTIQQRIGNNWVTLQNARRFVNGQLQEVNPATNTWTTIWLQGSGLPIPPPSAQQIAQQFRQAGNTDAAAAATAISSNVATQQGRIRIGTAVSGGLQVANTSDENLDSSGNLPSADLVGNTTPGVLPVSLDVGEPGGPIPKFDYVFRTYDDINYQWSDPLLDDTFPGQIIGQVDLSNNRIYNVNIYQGGILNDPTVITNVIQLNINDDDIIQPNVWALVSRVTFADDRNLTADGKATFKTEYYMNAPTSKAATTYPGQVISVIDVDNGIYAVNVYLQGVTNSPTVINNVLQLDKAIIDVNTWALINKLSYVKATTGLLVTEYYMEAVPTAKDIATYPGQVITQISELVYSVSIYENGITNAPTSVQAVIQLQLEPSQVITSGTWTLVDKITYTDISHVKHTEYYMQIPSTTGGSSTTFPGQVYSQISGSIYSVAIYIQGTSNAPTVVNTVQLQISTDDVIPYGTWGLVTRISYTDSEGNPQTEYYMQIPVWL